MDPENQHPAFDPDEQAILSQLRPEEEPHLQADEEGNTPNSEPSPADASTTTEPSAAPAPAPAEAPAPAPAADAPAPAPAAAAPAPAAAPVEQPKPQGDPRAALRAARNAERRLRDENERLLRELEDARQGKKPVDTHITDEELEQLEQDFPLQAKLVRRQREIEQQIAAQRPAAPASTEFEAPSYRPEVQEVIDSVPDLVAWQYDPNAQDRFQRAVEYDKALLVDPDWKGRSVAERFAEAVERTKRAFGATPAPAPAPSAQPALDPAAALAAAPASGPRGISDFRGGGPAAPPERDFSAMSDEEILASLTPS